MRVRAPVPGLTALAGLLARAPHSFHAHDCGARLAIAGVSASHAAECPRVRPSRPERDRRAQTLTNLVYCAVRRPVRLRRWRRVAGGTTCM